MKVLGTTSLAQTITLQTLEGGPSGEGARWWLSQGCRRALMLCPLLFSSTISTHGPCKCDFCYIRHCMTQNQSPQVAPENFEWSLQVICTEKFESGGQKLGLKVKIFVNGRPTLTGLSFITSPVGQAM